MKKSGCRIKLHSLFECVHRLIDVIKRGGCQVQPPYTVYHGLTNDNFCFCIYAQSLVPAGIGIWYNINRCFASSVIA